MLRGPAIKTCANALGREAIKDAGQSSSATTTHASAAH
jgi:hypothetical protein